MTGVDLSNDYNTNWNTSQEHALHTINIGYIGSINILN